LKYFEGCKTCVSNEDGVYLTTSHSLNLISFVLKENIFFYNGLGFAISITFFGFLSILILRKSPSIVVGGSCLISVAYFCSPSLIGCLGY